MTKLPIDGGETMGRHAQEFSDAANASADPIVFWSEMLAELSGMMACAVGVSAAASIRATIERDITQLEPTLRAMEGVKQ